MKQELEEQLSAFVDGELDAAEAELLLRQLGNDEALIERVRRFQLIGGSLRRQPVAGADFITRVHEALDESEAATLPKAQPRSWRRFAAGGAMAATVALIALAGLNFSLESNQSDPADQVAAIPQDNINEGGDSYTVPTPAVAAGNQVFVEPRLVNYMMRHGQLGPVITRTNIQATAEADIEGEESEADVEEH